MTQKAHAEDWADPSRGESKHLDYKDSMSWDSGRESLLKHIIAMSNIRDGGRIIIGVPENRDTKKHEVKGLTAEELRTFDPTKVAQYVNAFVQPGVRVGVDRRDLEGKPVIVLDVAEFDHVPNICTKPGPGGVFKAGDLLIRNDAPESRAIATAEEMRELLRLALGKTTENLLRDVRRIVEGERAEEQPEEPFAELLASWSEGVLDFAQRIQAARRGRVVPVFEARIVPTEAVFQIDDPAQLRELVRQATVNAGDYPFPSSPNYESFFTRVGFVEGIETIEEYEHEWRNHALGPFVFAEVIPETSFAPDRWAPARAAQLEGRRFLRFARVCDKVGLAFMFAQRLFERRDYDGPLRLDFRWTDTKDRILLYDGPLVWDPARFVCKEPEVRASATLSAVDFKAGWEPFALALLKQVFGLFQASPDTAAMETRLRKLRGR